MKFLWLTLLVLVGGLMFGSGAFAADLVFEDDTIVTLGGHDYVILAGSEADSVDVADTSVTVTVPSGSTFTFQSPDRHVLNSSPNVDQACTSSDNRLVITGPKTDVVITPDSSTLCTVPVDDPSSSASSGDSVVNQVHNLIAMGNYQAAWALMQQWPHLFSDQERQALQELLLELPVEPEPEAVPDLPDQEALRQQLKELQLQLIPLLEQLVERLQEQLARQPAEAV